MLTAILPVLFIVVGAVVYLVSANPKFQELGRLLFAAGAFAIALSLSGRPINL